MRRCGDTFPKGEGGDGNHAPKTFPSGEGAEGG